MALKTVKFLGTTLTALALATALNGCASVSGQTTLERDYDFTRMQNMTMVFYREFLSNEKITNNFKKELRNSECVMRSLTRAIPGAYAGLRTEWTVDVLRECSFNAAVLNTGTLVLSNCTAGLVTSQDELAYLVSVAFAHSLLEHDNERVSILLKGKKFTDDELKTYIRSDEGYQAFMQALGLEVKSVAPIPYTKEQVRAADELAIATMSAAGFNPSASLVIWQNLKTVNNARAQNYVLLHPHDEQDMQALSDLVQKYMPNYRKARTEYGRVPLCR